MPTIKLRIPAKFSLWLLLVILFCLASFSGQETIQVGETGFGVKRPVMAATCENGCPWGEIGDCYILIYF